MNSLYIAVKVSIVSDTPGIFAGGSNNNSFIHLVGSNIRLTCSITSTPATNSMFKWRCSTGCLVDVKMEQTISANIQKSGEIFCAYTVDDIEYSSDPIEINVTGKIRMYSYVRKYHGRKI